LKIKLKGRHFHTTEVIETESHAALNTLTEKDFQDAFQILQKRWERCICAEWVYFEVMVASTEVFYQMAAPTLEYAITKNQVGLKLNGTYQIMASADDVHLLGHNIDTTKKNTETLMLVRRLVRK
jgi:hypothetical protein